MRKPCLHRRKPIGKLHEFRVCTRCLRVWQDPESLATAILLAKTRGYRRLRDTYTSEELVLLDAVIENRRAKDAIGAKGV